jgi:hypothetical protein
MAALYSHTTRTTGTVLTAAIYNADHENHITNGVPAQFDDESANVAAMQATSDPGESGVSPTRATSLQLEIQQIRHILNELTGHLYWYQSPELAAGKVPMEMFS